MYCRLRPIDSKAGSHNCSLSGGHRITAHAGQMNRDWSRKPWEIRKQTATGVP